MPIECQLNECQPVEGFYQSCYSPPIMSIFLVTAVPLVSFLYLSQEFRGLSATKTFKNAFISGFILSIISLLILAVINYYVQERYSWIMVFLCHWIFDVLLFTMFSVGGYFLFTARRFFFFDKRKDYPFLFAYFSGYFTPVGFYMLMRNFYTLDS